MTKQTKPAGAGHTPGPWLYRCAGNLVPTVFGRGVPVATINDGPAHDVRVMDANARLIAAAPALLAALEQSAESLRVAIMLLDPPEPSQIRETYESARAAIAQAKGEGK